MSPRLRLLLPLALGLSFVLGCRALLHIWLPGESRDFDVLYQAAADLIGGKSPYPLAAAEFPYPLPAVLLVLPFTALPLELARLLFDVLVGWVFGYALWKYRGSYALLALGSGAYLAALGSGQVIPLLVAASLIPALGFILAVKPTTSAALWIAHPSWLAILGVILFFVLTLAVAPSWPKELWLALPADKAWLTPPLLRPFGFVLLLAILRWRSPEGRLLFATAFIPQTGLPYELVPLALIPANRMEMGIYAAGTWVVATAADPLLGHNLVPPATAWPLTLCAVYLPMLYLVLRRPGRSRELRLDKERRRPNRLPDEELGIDVAPDEAGGVSVTVTHLPSRQFVTESGPNRHVAERKAHDKLAAILAQRLGGRAKGLAS